MDSEKEAWQYLIDVVFNNKKDIPIELVNEFRKLASLHKLDYYCDFLRSKKLPDSLLTDPWEWEYLDDLSKILPTNIQILVLKGATARDMDLYPFPNLRKSDDLDIFVFNVKDYKSQKDFIEYLINKGKTKPLEGWELRLKKIKNVVSTCQGNHIDMHFDLFSPLGNLSNFVIGTKNKNENLEKLIIEGALQYNNLPNIKVMNYEDFWLYNTFHFLKDFPQSTLTLLVDNYLLLVSKKVTVDQVLRRAKNTNQNFLFYTGLTFLNKLASDFFSAECLNGDLKWVYRKFFKIEKLFYANKYSIKTRFLDAFSKCSIASNGQLLVSLFYTPFYLILNNLVFSNIDERFFSLQFVSNFITKILCFFTKFKNLLKSICLKAARTYVSNFSNNIQVIPTKKKLISVKICDLKLTFNVSSEFFSGLEKVWKDFLTDNHLGKKIEVEKINNDEQDIYSSEVVYSDSNVYLKLSPNCYGNANLNGSGIFYARTFWDVRTFALYLFRAMTFEREDLLLLHAGGVKIKGETLIFPGGTSAGKTTLFNLLVRNGASEINDDTVLLKYEDAAWFVYPTPFMSNYKEPLICEKSKLSGIIDPVKVCGGHEIRIIDKNYGNAIVLNNSLSGFLIDDSGFLLSRIANKVINLSKQVLFYGQIKYSLDDELTLVELINKWLEKPNEVYSTSSHLIRLIELQGNSMEPTFKKGDILCVEEIFPEKLKPKDVICFSKDPNDFPVVHRVKYLIRHKDSTTIITKGDGSIYEDPPSAFKANQKILKVTNKFKLGNSI